ncbi:hypothetical protein V2S66_22795 [Streptomyces sp. V4-01]|uniref:Uncharacterized protein n=1 Tax=Actinacidiphila polyblastidii TaxID=3110430 RepID=A0ABU7PGE8_9ACTN|nr:hypothetical protein [Streptomyces sp. V4-01]
MGAPRERHRRCEGVFRSDDGRTLDPDAAISQPLSPGDVLSVQRTGDGGYVRVGVSALCGWLAVALLGVVVAGALALGGLAVFRGSAPRAGWRTLAALGAAALLCGLAGAVAGAVT